MGLLDNLNEVQRQIVTEADGRVLVLAGAGSGKTRVLTHRVAYLVKEKGVWGSQILAITFTNKATTEMRERLDVLLGEGHGVWISTIHSLAARILRRFGDQIGYDQNFSIYDESDTARIITKVLTEAQIDDNNMKCALKEHISKAKNEGMSPLEYFKEINGIEEDAEQIAKLYARYEEISKSNNAMDFDDLLHKLKKLLLTSEEALNYCQNKFRYVHVDEFQDTNKVQYEIIKMLSAKWENLFVVGDDDQSIYGWRGARVENILNFDKDFEDVKVYKLLENYRSTTEILDTANNVIQNNKARHDKKLFTNRGKGVKVEYYNAWNDRNEAEWVVSKIDSLIYHNGYRRSDFAILVRANSLTRLFEQKLSECRLTYRVIGGFKFFDRKEIQDVIAYIRAVANKRDNAAIERIINFPARGIGDATVEKLDVQARKQAISIFQLLMDLDNQEALLGKGVVKKVETFASLMKDIELKKSLPVDKFVEYVVDRVGFKEVYMSSKKEEDITRWENIQQFINYAKEYTAKNDDPTLEGFLETVTLEESGKDDEPMDKNKVTIATMHAVKGLEFRAVFIVGCEEDTFPSAMAKKNGELEEERRIMYVAITRAKERLYISNAQRRFRFGRVQDCLPSRFIAEATGKSEDAYKTFGERRAYVENRGPRPDYLGDEPVLSKIRESFATRPRVEVKPQIAKPQVKDLTGYVGGAKVRHPNYGEGTILVVLGEGKNATATVAFPNLGVKKFIISLAPLSLVK